MSAARSAKHRRRPSARNLAPAAAGAKLSRREFLQGAALAGTVALVPPALGAMPGARTTASLPTQHLPPQAAPSREPRVSFFMDQPYLDLAGEAHPYVPPVGLRAAAHPSAQHMESLFHVC
jgi:hypothetical protein